MTEEQLKNIKTWAHWARLELARNKKKTPQVFTPEYYDDEFAFVETVEGLLSENEKLREENKTLFDKANHFTEESLQGEVIKLRADIENSRARELKHRTENERLQSVVDKQKEFVGNAAELRCLLREARKHLCCGDDSSETEDLLDRIDAAIEFQQPKVATWLNQAADWMERK